MTTPTDRITLTPDIVAQFAAYYETPGNGAWRSLHIVLDDGNAEAGHAEWCEGWASEHGDAEGERLAGLLAKMTETQRAVLPSRVNKYIATRRLRKLEGRKNLLQDKVGDLIANVLESDKKIAALRDKINRMG